MRCRLPQVSVVPGCGSALAPSRVRLWIVDTFLVGVVASALCLVLSLPSRAAEAAEKGKPPATEEKEAIPTPPMEMVNAAMDGQTERVATLLRQGVDVNAANSHGQSALMWAAAFGRADVVRLLLGRGVSVDTRDKVHGRTALLYAAQNGQTAAIDMLLARGAQANVRDRDGCTAMIYAARRGGVGSMTALLRKQADINAGDRNGETPLMWAAQEGQVGAVRWLLDKGADVNQKCRRGRTAADYAQGRIREMLRPKPPTDTKEP